MNISRGWTDGLIQYKFRAVANSKLPIYMRALVIACFVCWLQHIPHLAPTLEKVGPTSRVVLLKVGRDF